ncbi:hypothetical protein RM863_11720 [Streptomyces sp. DSM 41014]|uniref:Uncharacterized protein n=1 Tax=Streptomyces hintoniae TaxID=3075521 RepID=A0ABU2UI65_9ACTN|nr:hypothetical protein [Streptomyces sp. DSM 41014]MDT0472794.1 hypothetical protein [Streptomyces sp. DSM 41014]
MQDYQAIVRVRHRGLDLAVNAEALDIVTAALDEHGASAQLWPDVSEWTMTVSAPSVYAVAPVAGRSVQRAYARAGAQASVVRVDAWQAAEWDRAHSEGVE